MKNFILKIFTCFLLSSFLTRSYSQSLYRVSEDEKTSNATLIVEGKVIDQKSFWNRQHSMIYTSNAVEVYKIFKGSTLKDTIEIVTQGGSIDNAYIEVTDLLALSKNDMGVFYCQANSIGLRSPDSKNILYDVYSSAQGFLKYDHISGSANAPFVKYANIERDLYKDIQTKTGRSFENRKPLNKFSSGLKTNRLATPMAPGITSFSPAIVNAGAVQDVANNELTINGSGFGTPTGSAAVLFDDANDGPGGSFISTAASSPLITSWTDTQIKIKVPTRAGTGNFYVQDASGVLSASGGTLTVLYSILTAVFVSGGTFVKEINLMDDDGLGGYTVVYSTSTLGSGVDLDASAAKFSFQRALNTWKEICGFAVTEGGTTTNQIVDPTDGINTIMFDNSNTGNAALPAGVLGVCYSSSGMCAPVATNAAQSLGFDIVIRNNGYSVGSTSFTLGPCPPASSSMSDIDMEMVLLHELGHAIGLGHVIDGYQGTWPNVNPGKLMNYAVVNGVKRSTPDYSAKAGADYSIAQQGNAYCFGWSELVPLTKSVESKDDCPLTFPSTATAPGTVVTFDLVHATSNRFVDPQYTVINCTGIGTGVTNTAFYALKTGAGSVVSLSVSGYTTTPASQSSCSVAGVELALYAVSSCPSGQAFPAPIACRTFNANGALADFTGLAANTNYLIMVDGIENTKASFSLTFAGGSLPINIKDFTGEVKDFYNHLKWKVDFAKDVKSIFIEKSANGSEFERIAQVSESLITHGGEFKDLRPFIFDNYYRLAILNMDGTVEYSKVLLLKRSDALLINVFPNPANEVIRVDINSQLPGKYSIKLRNSLGQDMMSREVVVRSLREQVSFNVKHLSSGFYHISIYDEKMEIVATRSIKIKK